MEKNAKQMKFNFTNKLQKKIIDANAHDSRTITASAYK